MNDSAIEQAAYGARYCIAGLSDAVDATTTVYFIAPAFFRVITTCDTVDAF